MKIGEGLVLGAALIVTAGCSAERPAAPTQPPHSETAATPSPTSPEQCAFAVGGVVLRDKATRTFEITNLYASGKATPDTVCTPTADTQVPVFDVSKAFTEPHDETGQTVHIGSEIVARCITVSPSHLGIEGGAGQDAVAFRGDVDTQIISALRAPLPNCFDLLPSATK